MNEIMVQYYDNDFSFEEHASEHADVFERSLASEYVFGTFSRGPAATAPPAAKINVDAETTADADLHPNAQSERWDGFHTAHSSGNFFRSRRYITKCFPCILDHSAASACNTNSNGSSPRNKHDPQQRRVILEIGCGSGSTCIPILNELAARDNSNAVLLACDSSPVAVETTRRCVEKSARESAFSSFGAFVSDPSLIESEVGNRSFLESAAVAYHQVLKERNEEYCSSIDADGEIADVIICVFVLSAVWPARVPRFLNQIYRSTRPGGKVCFRDYGMYDLPMMRFPASSYVRVGEGIDFDGCSPRLFVRSDGTLSRFFHVETIKMMFEEAGFETEQLRYATVYNYNRKTKQRLKRLFVHGLFRRPEKSHGVHVHTRK